MSGMNQSVMIDQLRTDQSVLMTSHDESFQFAMELDTIDCECITS